eukprot:11518635-Alexandrium_andersonii.AAC.1
MQKRRAFCHAAADLGRRCAWLKAGGQPSKLIFRGGPAEAERASMRLAMQKACASQPPPAFWQAAAERAAAYTARRGGLARASPGRPPLQ